MASAGESSITDLDHNQTSPEHSRLVNCSSLTRSESWPGTSSKSAGPSLPRSWSLLPPCGANTRELIIENPVDNPVQVTNQCPRKATTCDIIVQICTLLFYLVNIGSDIWLACLYFMQKSYMRFSMTVAFIVLPGMLVSFEDFLQKNRYNRDSVPFIHCIFRVLLLAPAFYMIKALKYGLQTRRYEGSLCDITYQEMRFEEDSAHRLKLHEAFLENTPQLVLQLYIVVRQGTTESTFLVAVQIIGLVTSLTSLAWAPVSHLSAIYAVSKRMKEISWPGKACIFVWYLLTILARIIAFALFASYFEGYIFAIIGVHFITMSGCICKRIWDQDSGVWTFTYIMMWAFINIFCYYDALVSRPPRLLYLVYYTIIYIENTGLILTWYIFAPTLGHGVWYATPAVGMVMGGFFLGILFQIIYYLWFHPNHREIRLCVPLSELRLFPEKAGVDGGVAEG